MKGVCCSCQRVELVRPYSPNSEEKESMDFGCGPAPEVFWVMVPHTILPDGQGVYCEGTGTTPQALVK